MSGANAFLQTRDLLLSLRADYAEACRRFAWPALETFNWALDYFDPMARGNTRTALWIVHESGAEDRFSFAQMAERSNRTAQFLRRVGVRRGDRILLMLGNEVELWDTLLAACKLGAVVIPAATLLSPEDLHDRLERGAVRHVIAAAAHAEKFARLPGDFSRIAVGGAPGGWLPFAHAQQESNSFAPDATTRATDPLLLYFTSGTTAQPKLVQHSHQSYPVGHLSTMYWIGLQPGDVHWNISTPGWAKHAWSCWFAPWNAGATVFAFNYARFQAKAVLQMLAGRPITTLCAPPTVWRMLVQEKLTDYPVCLREALSAGEPLNPEVIARVEAAWRLTIRDGYGQTETTAICGNTPGQPLKSGSMGRPLPGFRIELLGLDGQPASEGEICLDLKARPLGLMAGYGSTAESPMPEGGFYHTGDLATRDEDGYITYIGRIDDVFKSSDYRISPFELESVLVRHPAVAEAAVVAAHDPVRHTVPKAFLLLAEGHTAGPELARDIFRFVRQTVAPYKRVRRLEFRDLPKTISGKIRRVQLRTAGLTEGSREYREDEFPET